MSKGTSPNTSRLSKPQIDSLETLLHQKGWTFRDAPHAYWRAEGENAVVIAYQSGKLVAQGKGAEDFVRYILEPSILGEARYGDENVLAETEDPGMFTSHAGIDESGKGDYFGPLVIAAAYVDETLSKSLLEAGVTDSKAIKSDQKIQEKAELIQNQLAGKYAIVPISPKAYNRLKDSMHNVNRVLAWAHARSLENLIEQVPECDRAVADQFGNKETIEKALLPMGRKIELQQQHKAESDVAVAAASILARWEFVKRLRQLGNQYNTEFPKGANAKVVQTGQKLVKRYGSNVLREVAKEHFRTTEKVLQ